MAANHLPRVRHLPVFRIFELRCAECGRQVNYCISTADLTSKTYSLYDTIRQSLENELDDECVHVERRVLLVVPHGPRKL